MHRSEADTVTPARANSLAQVNAPGCVPMRGKAASCTLLAVSGLGMSEEAMTVGSEAGAAGSSR